MDKTEVRAKGGRNALAHYDYKSLDFNVLVSVSNAQPFPLN